MAERNSALTYDAAHLSTEEVRAVCHAVQAHIMQVCVGDRDADILDADLIKLQDEYDFWAKELEARLDERKAACI